MHRFFRKKTVLVTGACGTVGSELVSQLLGRQLAIEALIGIDNSENQVFLASQSYASEKRVQFFAADIRDRDEMVRRLRGVDIVFHCAALKHVDVGEKAPNQIVRTNIIGLQNIIAAAAENKVGHVIFSSSDKAVNPTSVMGTSKLMGERLITAANTHDGGTVFASTRFGNVLGSNGSVVPIFARQIAQGGPVTLTHKDMTRFVMGVNDAVRLLIASASLARGGEVFITKMPTLRIEDLAHAMIEMLAPKNRVADIPIREIGIKPGEKLYEELVSSEEVRRTMELKDYYVVMPAFRRGPISPQPQYGKEKGRPLTKAYNSANEPAMSVKEIKSLLKAHGLV